MGGAGLFVLKISLLAVEISLISCDANDGGRLLQLRPQAAVAMHLNGN